MRMIRTLCAAVMLPAALIVAAASATAATTAAPPEFPGLELIRRTDLMNTVAALASPGLQGRMAGSPGYMRAARDMAARMKGLGLEPGGDDGYFQKLTVEYCEIPVCRMSILTPGARERPLALGPDFTCRGLTGSGTLTAPLVFVGYGLSRPEKGYDDYAGIDVRGKIVVAFKEAPPFKPDSGGWGGTLPRAKGRVAAAHGAVAMVMVSRPAQAHPQTRPIGSMLEGAGGQDIGFPRLQVSIPVADELLRTAGIGLDAAQAGIDSTKAPHSFTLDASARIDVKASYHAMQPSVNVVGLLRGSDSTLAGECFVVGAHLDHVGSQGGGRLYFPGANDNASGSAAVMAIAEAFARGGVRPKRTVVFALFSSEEAGLHGARRFVAAPPVPREHIAAFLNMDCVGHGDSIEVGGGTTWPRLWQLAGDLDRSGAGLMVQDTSPGGEADAEPFDEAGIPTLYFASKPSYTFLHLPQDTPATLNPPLLEAIARLSYRTLWTLARDGITREPRHGNE